MAPTMAMAPMDTVREAVTKAWTNLVSPLFPVFSFSHSPNFWKPASMPISSPITVPMARQRTTSMDRPPLSAPFSIFSMPSMAPATAMNSTLTPQAVFRESCCSGRNIRPIK